MSEHSQDDDDQEYSRAVEEVRSSWDRLVRSFNGLPQGRVVATQMAVGGASGMLSGFLFVRVGKVAAASIGTSVLIFQIAHHLGYIKIDWKKVQQSARRAEVEVRRTASSHASFAAGLRRFILDNVYLASGFAGGFFIGVIF